MEEPSGIATSVPSETSNIATSVNSNPSDSVNFQYVPNNLEIYPTNSGHVEVEMASGERSIPLPELKNMLRQQLEYYFSRENLSTDAYLNSQMDADNYVPIATIAKFNQIRRLTEDLNLVVEVLRESAVVQVDEIGEKVRPNPRSGILILREIPESTPIKELEELFNSENCPKFSRCEFAHNNSWYVLFDTDEDTQKAYRYLREEAKTFNGKPIMARIKAKAITSAPFTTSYKNGASNASDAESYNAQNVNQQQPNAVQYTYNVPNEGYNNQQVCPPFYPPTMLQTWAPTTPACVDLGTVLSVNGLSPQAAFRPLSNANRHNYSSRDRPVKAYTPQNYNFSRSEQSRYFNRGQSTSYLQRQQLHQQPSFHNIVNSNSCGFDYMPYTSRSRNVANFGMDMNFFTAPNLYYSKFPSIYPTHTSQTRHNATMLVPRNQVGISAINNQDQSYLAVGSSTVLPYSKDSAMNASSVSSKQADAQVKENWGPNQRQQRGKRWWKENGSSSSAKTLSESANGVGTKSLGENDGKSESPKFDLETSSFPPLPGCMEPDSIDVDVYQSRLSDIVKGTVKPTTRDTKTQTSESGPVCAPVCNTKDTKDSSTITIEDAVIPSDGAFTPPMSPDLLKETASANEPIDNDNFQEQNEWDEFVETANDSSLCNTSINSFSVVPETSAVYSSSNLTSFHSISTNSVMNGSVTVSESASNISEIEIPANVPTEVESNKQVAVPKLPKSKQLDSLPKNRSSDLPSPKNKTPETSKAKFDVKDRTSNVPKHRTSFSNSKNTESSSKEKMNDFPVNAKAEHVSKNSDNFLAKEKQNQGHGKGRALDTCSNKTKSLDSEISLLSVNGHVDSESTVSSEDEKPCRKLTYSEVAMRAKEKVEKIAQELKEKERQEAMVRQHRQQEIVAQSKQSAARAPFREFPRGRVIEPRSGSKDWRERRKPARTISLPTAGQ